MEVLVFIATSLDGSIARADGSIDWLPGSPEDGGSDFGYGAFIARVDAILMGRKTFGTVLGFGTWPYDKPVYVASSTLREVPDNLAGKVRLVSGSPRDILAALARDGVGTVYLDGGATIQSFLREDLVDEMTITTIATLIGKGRSLFGELDRDVHFSLVACAALGPTMVQARYRRQRELT